MTDSTVDQLARAPDFPRVLASDVFWVAVIAAATIAFYNLGPLGPDVSWLITVSERILAGQTLYVDILEPNPPMAGYLYMIPAWLAQTLGVSAEPLVILYTTAFGLATTGVSAWLVRRAGLLPRSELLWPISFLLVGAAWGEDFAQREHFATMAALPLLVAVALRAQGRKPATWHWILAGLCGGLMLAIKPHFALPIALPVLYAATRQRSLRPLFGAPELWLAGSILLAFTAMIWFAFPGFFSNIMPVATTAYVPDRRDPLLLLSLPVVLFFLVLTVFGLVAYRQKIAGEPLLGALFFCAIGFFVAYFAQSRGYLYQILPAIALMSVFVLMSFAQNVDEARKHIGAALAAMAALAIGSVPMLYEIHQWRVRQPLYAAVEPYGPGLKIVSILPDLTAGSPLHRVVDGTLVNSPPGLLMSMSAIRLQQERAPTGAWAEALLAVEQGERTRLREDMLQQPPDIIVTAASHFDWFTWAKEDSQVAELVREFEEFAVVPFDGYDIRLLKRPGLEAQHVPQP